VNKLPWGAFSFVCFAAAFVVWLVFLSPCNGAP